MDANDTHASDMHRLVKQRMEKAEALREKGLNPFANDFSPELACAEFHARYDDESTEALKEINTVRTVAGRLMNMRQMGKATFLRIKDRSGELQVFLRKDVVGEDVYAQLKLSDLGDILGIVGTPMRTRTGELTIAADAFRILTKSYRPLPDKFHGLANVEARYRQRYLDLAVNDTTRHIFKTRSRIIRGIQKFLDTRDFIEVETPILGEVAGGATARPFLTHHNTLDIDFQMRIATELHLKRLVVGGLERVYEIGRLFRNEGMSTKHNPEFTSIEFYQAYATYTDLMEMTEEMVTTLAEDLHGSTVVPFGDMQVDFKRPWRRASIASLVQENLGIEESLDAIDSVVKALEIVTGNCGSPDEPLMICLKELSDEEAGELIPGLATDLKDQPTVPAALQAFKERGDAAAFYKELGEALDAAWGSPVTPDLEKFEKFEEKTDSGNQPKDDFDTDTGEIVLPGLPDPMRVRRRRLALALLYAVFDHRVEETLRDPTFITDFSVSVSPLARRRDNDPAVVDRFELICAGMEIANAFSELNDPVDQRERFEAQMRERERGDVEAHEIDEDYVRALETGMPPTAGEGIGIDRLVMLLTDQTSIREVILFPQLRREG